MKKELVVYIGGNKYVPVSTIPRLNALMPGNDFLDKVWHESLLNECWVLRKLLSISEYQILISEISKIHPDCQLHLFNPRFGIQVHSNPKASYSILIYSSINESIVKMFNGRNAFVQEYTINHTSYCQSYPFKYKTTSSNSHGVRRNKNGSYTLFKFDKAFFQYKDGSGHKFENKYKNIKSKFNNIREVLDYVVDNNLTISKSYIKDFDEWIDSCVEQDCYHGLSGFSEFLTF